MNSSHFLQVQQRNLALGFQSVGSTKPEIQDVRSAVSDTDSFIDEVSEEIRREKLFKTFRKYGWIGVALVVIVVGGTGYREYSRAAEKPLLKHLALLC